MHVPALGSSNDDANLVQALLVDIECPSSNIRKVGSHVSAGTTLCLSPRFCVSLLPSVFSATQEGWQPSETAQKQAAPAAAKMHTALVDFD